MLPASPRALIVDDDRLVRMLVARSLSAERIACDQAEDGEAAAKKLDEFPYDIVVTDLMMPNRHGHSLCQAVLSRPTRPVLIVITGLAEPRLIQDLKVRGVDAIVQKPIDFPAFSKQVRALYEARRTAEHESLQKRLVASETPTLADAPPPRRPIVAILMSAGNRAQQLAVELRGDALEVFVPQTTESLCQFVENHQVDVMVIEDVAYGFLTGAEILARLQGPAAPRQAVVIGTAAAFTPDQAQSLKIRRIFSNTATDSDLIQAVRSALAEVERAADHVSPEAAALVKSFGGPAHSPAVLVKLTQYLQMSAAEIPIEQLSRDIMADPATAAELLRLANGSSLGVRRQITEIAEALIFLGKGRSVSLLVSSGIRNVERGLLRRFPVNLRAWYQLRTIVIASVSSLFAERHFGLSADTAFVLGLFQDMGILVLANAYGERYLRLIKQARSVGPVRLHALEQQYFHVNHAEVSAALVGGWRLPGKLVPPICHHHDMDVHIGDRNEALAFVQPMRIGEAFANLWDNRHPTRRDAISKLLAECRSGQSADFDATLNEAVQKAAEVAQLFLLPLPDEAAALAVCKDVVAAYSDLCGQQATATPAK